MELEEFLSSVNKEECPFDGLKLSEDWKRLHLLDDRSVCPSCKKSRKYFCYTCFVAVPEVEPYLPRLQLPIKLDIIKHKREMDGKSTAVHAAVLAPQQVTVYTYPCIPDYTNQHGVALVFPGKDAVSVKDIVYSLNSSSDPEMVPLTKVVFIDSTWNQTKGILKDPRISGLACAVLKSRLSQFWRHQKGSPRSHLATIEAIHQFYVEYELALGSLRFRQKQMTADSSLSDVYCSEQHNTLYNGEYDNLMFFFRFMYDKIHNLYDHDALLSYKRPVPQLDPS